MSYKVHDTKRGHVFKTLDEARAYAAEVFRACGVFVAVTESRAKPTHIYEL